MAAEIHSEGLNNILVILGAAGIVIPAFARFRITPIIGFILVGILVGPFGLGALSHQYDWLRWITIDNAETIKPIGEYGIILLLFSIGLELSFRRLWSMRTLVFGVGAASEGSAGGACVIPSCSASRGGRSAAPDSLAWGWQEIVNAQRVKSVARSSVLEAL